jgi:hypothetical protein
LFRTGGQIDFDVRPEGRSGKDGIATRGTKQDPDCLSAAKISKEWMREKSDEL